MERKLTNVYLGGKLGQLFGKEWKLAVYSPEEAIRAIDANVRGKFRRYLGEEGRSKYYKVGLQTKNGLIDGSELRHRSGNSDIYIYPTISGRNSGTGKIIAGVIILAVVTYFTWGTGTGAAAAAEEGAADEGEADAVAGAGAAAGGSSSALGFGGWAGNILSSIGTSLILGGISQLLAPHKNAGGELNSNIFTGTITEGQQGGCVPVVYGKALVSPLPISVWFNNIDYNVSVNEFIGGVQIAQLPGGGYEYSPTTPVSANVGDDSGD